MNERMKAMSGKGLLGALLFLAGIMLGLPEWVAAGECYPGDEAVCYDAYGREGVQKCIKTEDYPVTQQCKIEDKNATLTKDACNCGGCYCTVTSQCCFGENLGDFVAYDDPTGSCRDDPKLGTWDACEVDLPPTCGADETGNPTNLITGNVDFTPSRPDVEFWDRQGRFSFGRRYSSQRHISDLASTVPFSPLTWPAIWTPGWVHDHQYQLLVSRILVVEDSIEQWQTFYFYTHTDDHKPALVGCVGPYCSFRLEQRFKIGFQDNAIEVNHLDGTKVLLKSRAGDEGFSDPIGEMLLYVPVQVTHSDGITYFLTYYSPTASGGCLTNDQTFVGQLCRIDSNGGGYVWIDRYKLLKSGDQFVNLPPVATRLRYGLNNGSADVEYGRVTYSYPIRERSLPSGDEEGSNRYNAWLNKANVEKLIAPDTYELIHRESYIHGDHAYYRPDLGAETVIGGRTVSNPYADWKPIILQDGYGVDLLERAFNASGELISGHYYDQQGRGVSSFRPGEYLRVVYVDDYAPDERRVQVANESKGTQAEFAIRNGVLTNISDGLGCLKTTESIQYGDNWVAMRSVPPDGASPGVMSVRTYESAQRVLVSLKNWDALDSVPETAADAPSVVSRDDLVTKPARLRTYEYNSAHLDVPWKASLVYSALCPDAETFGYDCGGVASEPYLMRTFDPASKRVVAEQGVGIGIDPETGAVVQMSREDTFVYDAEGHLVESHDALGYGLKFTYYQSAGEQDPCSQVGGTAGGEHNIGRVKTVELLPAGSTIIEYRGNYDATGNPGCTIDENGVVTFLTHNDFGQVTERRTESESSQRLERYAYRADGKLKANTVGQVTTQMTYAAGESNTIPEYVDLDLAFCDTQGEGTIDAADVAARQAVCLDGLGNLGQATSVEEMVETSSDRVLFSLRQNTFNRLGKRTDVSTLDSARVLSRRRGYGYDLAGRLSEEFVFQGSPTSQEIRSHVFDRLGRPVQRQDPGFSEPNHEFAYDQLDRVTSVTVGKGTDEEATTVYGYDIHDNLTSVTDPDGRITRYLYDDFGRLVAVDSPDTGMTRYRYDLVGNLASTEEADGRVTEYEYDSRHRLIRERFILGQSFQERERLYDTESQDPATADCEGHVFQFEQQYVGGRLSTVRHEAGTTYYSYTPFGDVDAVYEQDGSVFDVCDLRITRYTYDESGRIASVTMPSGRVIKYVFAEGDRFPSRVELDEPDGVGGRTTRTIADEIAYDVDGQVTSYTAGGISFTGSWDLNGQQLKRSYTGAGQDLFIWDTSDRAPNGNIITARDDKTGKELELVYDGQDRLTWAIGTLLRGYQDCAFDYDGSGNRTGESCFGKDLDYDYELSPSTDLTNRLGSVSWSTDDLAVCDGSQVTLTQDFAPDVMGRATKVYQRKYPLASDVVNLSYGSSGRLTTVETSEGLFNYAYNHRNLRVSKEGPGVSTRFSYDESGRLLAEQGMSNATLREYVYLGDELLAMLVDANSDIRSPIGIYLLGTDQLGSPTRAWSNDEETVWAADYEAFGQVWEYVPGSSDAPVVRVPLRFPGQYQDDETGLHFNWHRYYDPSSGRFVTPDPYPTELLISAQWFVQNTLDQIYRFTGYSYAASDPIVRVDSDGRKCVKRWLINQRKSDEFGECLIGDEYCTCKFSTITLLRVPYWDDDPKKCQPPCKKKGKFAGLPKENSSTRFKAIFCVPLGGWPT